MNPLAFRAPRVREAHMVHLTATLTFEVEADSEETAVDLAVEYAEDNFPGISPHVEEWDIL